MHNAAVFMSIGVATFTAIFLSLTSKKSKAAEEKARARRIAEAKMNARLLRFNL